MSQSINQSITLSFR